MRTLTPLKVFTAPPGVFVYPPGVSAGGFLSQKLKDSTSGQPRDGILWVDQEGVLQVAYVDSVSGQTLITALAGDTFVTSKPWAKSWLLWHSSLPPKGSVK